MNENIYDVIVVGGGHAGIEAAHAAAKMGQRVALISLKKDLIGLMPCNPSIGGLGKGHMVYEISALGGLMPELCNTTYLQARMLNTSKGPAVQGLRLQIDKYAYKEAAQKVLEQTHNLVIVEDMANQLIIEQKNGIKKVQGVRLASGTELSAASVVITTGTFLRGRVHVGLVNHEAGRMGEQAAYDLSASLKEALGVELGRLKTGTPPRLLRESIDFSRLERQGSHDLEFLFSWKPVHAREKIPCYITYTNERTHEIIRSNLDKSAMYAGNIEGRGPRYCPSIEDKIARFPHREEHHVFIEPEGACCDEIYPAGLSTSLPLDVQEAYIRSIKGFEEAIITKAGYAVEYDMVQPTNLHHTLESKHVEGLFFAGQINGTTGYEEAASQGIVAGINAALKTRGNEQFVLDRTESYIGVMIDDLVTLGADEPYRMFTSRAERRLLLRQDNVFKRLMPYGYRLGLIDQATYDEFLAEQALIDAAVGLVRRHKHGHEVYQLFAGIEFDEQIRARAKELLIVYMLKEVENLSYNLGKELTHALLDVVLHSRLLLSIHAEIKYAGYLDREEKEVEKARKYQELVIPTEFNHRAISGLSAEMQEKLTRYKPKTIAQAQLIPGMTPAAISILIFQIRMGEQRTGECGL